MPLKSSRHWRVFYEICRRIAWTGNGERAAGQNVFVLELPICPRKGKCQKKGRMESVVIDRNIFYSNGVTIRVPITYSFDKSES